MTFGNADFLRRFIAGIFEENPSLPEQSLWEIWYVHVLLSMFKTVDASITTDPEKLYC